MWVKHENHTPIGAFKVRGGLVYFDRPAARAPARRAASISATRGNHGQSLALRRAPPRHCSATIVVPHGNSREKNAAMRALGVELVEHGDDFQAAREHASALAPRDGLHMVPSFHPDLVPAWRAMRSSCSARVAELDAVLRADRPRLGRLRADRGARCAWRWRREIVGVVSRGAPAYALSLAAGRAGRARR